MYRFRHHVYKICNLNSPEERKQALSEVPEKIRDLVKQQVIYQYQLKKAMSRSR